MAEAQEAAGIGHNRDMIAEFRDLGRDLESWLRNERADLWDTAAALVDEVVAFPAEIDSDEVERKATDIGARINKFLKTLDNQRISDKAPMNSAGDCVQAFYGTMSKPLSQRLEILRLYLNKYKDDKAKAERDRVRAANEEAARIAKAKAEEERMLREQAAAEEAAFTAPMMAVAQEQPVVEAVQAPMPVAPMVKTESGAKSGQTVKWTGEIENFAELDLNMLRDFIAVPEIQDAVKRYALKYKGTKPLPGARIFEKTNTTFRS